MDDFPIDLIFKIFIRIPIKSLMKLRCVSKSWCNIIDDPFFSHVQYDSCEVEQKPLLLSIQCHTVGSPGPPKATFYAACDDNEETRVMHATKIPMAKFQVGCVRGSCKGLMYFTTDYYPRRKIVVSNPLRGQFRVLRPLYIGYDSDWNAIGLGFDSLTYTFKMVFLNKTSSSSGYCTLVQTLGTNSWREVSSVPAYYGQCEDNSVFVHGYLHWIFRPLAAKDFERWILAFDMSKETFKVIPPPETDFEKRPSSWLLMRILDIKGKLAMLHYSCRAKIDIWFMDYEKQLWSKEYTIGIDTIHRGIYSPAAQVIGLWRQDEILFEFFTPSAEYWSYSMKTGDLKKCDGQVSLANIYYSLRGSLISISGVRCYTSFYLR